MTKFVAVIFAGAMIASAGVPARTDTTTEERFRAKLGRYTPAEETRREALKTVGPAACEYPGCCQRGNAAGESVLAAQAATAHELFKAKSGRSTVGSRGGTAVTGPARADSGTEARFHAKLGRGTPQEEQRLHAAPPPQLLASSSVLCDHGCCRRN